MGLGTSKAATATAAANHGTSLTCLLPGQRDRDWWRQAVVYQIYPRSFCDANGDGIGDLKGIISKVKYLKDLGVDAVWLSPFYPSELADGGYDVIDYRNIDPHIGTLEDFDEMVATLKAHGIRTMVDIVPNHTSNKHEWFQAALKAHQGSKERDRYIFRDGLGSDKTQPPNDWQSEFGGCTWEPSGQNDGQFYMHIFAREQPDLNWANPEVRADFLKTLRFWADRGVAGFRVDVAGMICKDIARAPPYKSQKELEEIVGRILKGEAGEDEHPYRDRLETFEVYKGWREVFEEYTPALTGIAEAHVDIAHRKLWKSEQGLGQTFCLEPMVACLEPDKFREMVEIMLKSDHDTGGTTPWVLDSHDIPRHVTRYGIESCTDSTVGWLDRINASKHYVNTGGKEPTIDLELGLQRARAVTLALLSLPGSQYLYQGEELGLHEVIDIPASERQDPIFHRSNGKEVGRDGCRVPLPWVADAPHFGFGPKDGSKPHLPQPEWFKRFAADVEDGREGSTLEMYKAALKARREVLKTETHTWEQAEKGSLAWRRDGVRVVFNMTGEGVEVPKGEVLVCSGQVKGGKVPKWTTVWVKE